VERTGDKPVTFWRGLYWGWKLFCASKAFDVVVTGFERSWHAFALLQRLARVRKVPHVFIYAFFSLPDTGYGRALRRWYYRLIIGAASRIVVYSRHQIELYARVFDVPAEKFVSVPYHTTLYDAEYPVSEEDYVFAGGDFTRDYVTLIEAARSLPYQVIIAARFRDYFRGLDIPENVKVLTASHDQFLRLMAGAKVVVVPLKGGLLHSGGHQTYLNAMAMGKPVVVADDCGADEYITHGVTGILLRPGDSAELRESIRTLFENRDLARWLARNAKAAAANYSPERFMERVLAIAGECVESSRSG
jgi:glycosyltransferase involved in cell wall biosynthesis